MNWDVLCPNCRVSQETTTTLRDLNKTAHCAVCHITYDTNFDEYVELRFAVNPGVRRASSLMYCAMGSPALNQHIVAQQRLAAGETRRLAVALEAGGYNLRMLGSEQRCTLRVDPAATTAEAALTLTASGVGEAAAECAPGRVTLACANTSPSEQLLILEHDAWGSGRVSAALVTTLPEFRTLFSSEVLAPGLGLAIKNLTILFSDIKNSTPMYEQFGDSSAYAVVRDHFTTLFAAIEKHEARSSKTIGDAVMAVFCQPVSAVAAALDITRAINASNAERPTVRRSASKSGCTVGRVSPSMPTSAGYFGTTVNAAARAQSVSVGGDTVITADLMKIAGSRALAGALQAADRALHPRPQGLSQAYTLYRLTLASQAEPVGVE
jgi:class 3 adenylate cyclase